MKAISKAYIIEIIAKRKDQPTWAVADQWEEMIYEIVDAIERDAQLNSAIYGPTYNEIIMQYIDEHFFMLSDMEKSVACHLVNEELAMYS